MWNSGAAETMNAHFCHKLCLRHRRRLTRGKLSCKIVQSVSMPPYLRTIPVVSVSTTSRQ